MTESTWKILKIDWKTPGFFFLPKEWEPCCWRSVVYFAVLSWHTGESQGGTEFSRGTSGKQSAKDRSRNADAFRTAGECLEFLWHIAMFFDSR